MNDKSAPPGSAASFLCMGPGWATMSNAPFRRHKVWVHEGGIATPCIIHWPNVIGETGSVSGDRLRHAPSHVIDFVPTALELAGVKPPDKWNDQTRPQLPGRSLAPLLREDASIPRDCLYWNHEGNRALREDDWKIVSERERGGDWELYDLNTDRIESHNLAQNQPDRVKQMSERWQKLTKRFAREAGIAPLPK
jgi:arylsulfatase